VIVRRATGTPRHGRVSSVSSRRALGPSKTRMSLEQRVLSPEGKLRGRGDNHRLPTITDIKET
jgi:hypothetical protein